MGVLLLSFKAMVRMGCFWWAGLAGMPSAKVVEVEAEPMEGCYDGPIGRCRSRSWTAGEKSRHPRMLAEWRPCPFRGPANTSASMSRVKIVWVGRWNGLMCVL